MIQLQPNKPVGYAERGVTKSRQEDYAGAKEDFDRALKLDPDDQVALAGRALALQALGKFSSSVKDIGRAIDQGPERPYQRPTRLLGVEKLAHDLVALFDQGTFSLEVLPVSGEMLRSAFASVGGVGPAPVGEALLKAWGLLARGRTGTGFCNSIVYGYRSEAAALRMVKFQRGVMGKREQLLLSIKGITSASLTFAPCPGVPEGQGFVYTQRLEQDEAVVMSYGLVVQVGRHCLQSEQTDVPKLQARAVNAKQIEILKAAR
ncbi:MAG: tetratricopeptide repeat protein [Planctomycetes bacterium]|nr:tetratricopeptide repeat protein [Planctomycetota bacterium]